MAKKKTNTAWMLDELAAIRANMREAAARFTACSEQLAEARRGAAPECVGALEARAAAAVDELVELGQLVARTRQRTLRCTAHCERLAAAGRLGADERAAIDEARMEAGLAALRVGAKIFNALWGSPASGRRLAAIEARAGEAGRLATLEALARFIDEVCGGRA